MARVPAGVVVVSTSLDGEYRALTASSFVSISLEPPMILVGLDRESATRRAIVAAERFNVSVLSRAQEFIADRFAGRAPAIDSLWRSLPHRLGSNGIPLIDGSAAWLECRLTAVHPAGDHEILVGSVEDAQPGSGDPLILWNRSFWSLH